MLVQNNSITNRATIAGFPRYSFTEDGCVFKDGIPKAVSCKKGKAPQIIIRDNKRMHTFGFAKLIATAFLPNPNNYSKIIFKDGNSHNCKSSNLEWVDVSTWGYFNRTKNRDFQPNKRLQRKKPPLPEIDMSKFTPIAGLHGYFISVDGSICNGKLLKKPFYKKSVKVYLNRKERSVGKLLASTFIPNPNNYQFIIYKDRNNRNCNTQNIEWVSGKDYMVWTMGNKRQGSKKNHIHKKKRIVERKPLKSVWWQMQPALNDVRVCELTDYDLQGYYITSGGQAFKGCKQLLVNSKGKKAPILRIQKNSKRHYFGFAKLIAMHFVSNPSRRNHVIFKDRNNSNCKAENLAWVDGETFLEYSCGPNWKKGGKKKYFERSYAITHCKDIFMRSYYKTLDESLLHSYWMKINQDYCKFDWWKNIHSECFMYFMDRAKRFSILAPAPKMLWYYAKGQRLKLQNEISPDMSRYQASKVDETLRNRVGRNHYDSGNISDVW